MLNSEGEKKCNKQSDVTEAFKEEQKTFIWEETCGYRYSYIDKYIKHSSVAHRD